MKLLAILLTIVSLPLALVIAVFATPFILYRAFVKSLEKNYVKS